MRGRRAGLPVRKRRGDRLNVGMHAYALRLSEAQCRCCASNGASNEQPYPDEVEMGLFYVLKSPVKSRKLYLICCWITMRLSRLFNQSINRVCSVAAGGRSHAHEIYSKPRTGRPPSKPVQAYSTSFERTSILRPYPSTATRACKSATDGAGRGGCADRGNSPWGVLRSQNMYALSQCRYYAGGLR